MEVRDQLRASAALPSEIVPPVPTGWRLGGSQSRSGLYGEEKIILLLPGIEPRLVALPIELSLTKTKVAEFLTTANKKDYYLL
jgi:hypothetical protein